MCLRTSKTQLARHPTERKRLKVFSLQNDLQLSTAKAKSDYESNLALNYTHTNNNKIFQYIFSIKGRENFPAKMHYNDIQGVYLQPLIWTIKAQLNMTTFI